MELNERIAFVRKAAGLSQEQLGELLGVTRQAVSKWESGQTTPDAVTVAKLCRTLHVSADFVLLGKEPDEEAAQKVSPPENCPLCGGVVLESHCFNCGYPPALGRDDDGVRYALLAPQTAFQDRSFLKQIDLFRGGAEPASPHAGEPNIFATFYTIRRSLKKQEVLWLATHIPHTYLMRIVADEGEADDSLLEKKEAAMPLPPMAEAPKTPLGFGGMVAAVVVGVIAALLILSLF